jgi:dTDP-4-dehydrorhamnose reductase
MKIMVIGSNGQLGSDISKRFQELGEEVFQINHDQMDVVNFSQCKRTIDRHRPELIVNTAAMHNVEKCEEDPITSFEVNGIGARNLALLSNDYDFALMHVSTDYVFDGQKKTPYLETDLPRPLNVYGNSKLAGEFFVSTIAVRYYITRVSGLYGINPCRAKGGLNFVDLMLKLAKERDEIRVVDDEVLTPTYTADIAGQIAKLASTNAYGIYHVTAQGACSWYQFAAKIFELTQVEVKLNVAGPDEFPMKVPRPKYSVLQNLQLQNRGLDTMPHWEHGLKRYLTSYGILNSK